MSACSASSTGLSLSGVLMEDGTSIMEGKSIPHAYPRLRTSDGCVVQHLNYTRIPANYRLVILQPVIGMMAFLLITKGGKQLSRL